MATLIARLNDGTDTELASPDSTTIPLLVGDTVRGVNTRWNVGSRLREFSVADIRELTIRP